MRNGFSKEIVNSFKGTNIRAFGDYVNVYELDGAKISISDIIINEVLKGKKISKKIMVEFNGKRVYYDVSVNPIHDENGELIYSVIISHDITYEMEKRKLLEQQKKELEAIIDNMDDGLVVLDRNGRFIRTNKAVNEIMKRKTDIGKPVSEVGGTIKMGQRYFKEIGEELSLQDILSSRVLKGEEVKQQRVIVKNGLDKYYIDFNGIPIFDENGDFQYGVVISHDITDIIEKERKIKYQQELLINAEKEKRECIEKALSMKDVFISLISHEFKTPLNVVYTAIQSIEFLYFGQIPESVKGLVGSIKQNTFRQLRLVNNLLDITKLNAGCFKIDMKNIDMVFLTKTITESVKLYAGQKDIKLIFKSSLKHKTIGIDEEKYERIILNLLSDTLNLQMAEEQ